MPGNAIRDFYRCPEEFLNFQLAGELSPGGGYFTLGGNTTCYGRTVGGLHQPQMKAKLRDAGASISIENEQVTLPFDPDEIIINLRRELYPSGQLTAWDKVLKRIYYWFRPLTSHSLRVRIKRLRAGDWQEIQFPCWPVDTTVENICERLLLLSLQAKGLDYIPFVWFWPAGARGCVSMTHDVENAAGRDFCAQLLDIDESHGIKASFQIVPEERYAVTPEYLKSIRDRGFEINVHDLNHDGQLFDDRE